MTKVIFMGTPEIGKFVLEGLLELEDVNVIAVVCQPDRLTNRKKEVIYQPVKQLAIEKNILVFQPEKVKEITEEINNLKPDVIITCAFGQFINKEILAIPTYGCFNVHASLLPKLRGGAPIHWAIISGAKKSGMTLMKMISKMDAGDIISQIECEITQEDTYLSLYDKLKVIGKEIIKRDFHLLLSNNIESVQQNETEVTFGYNIKKEEELINFNQPVEAVDRWIRGLFNKPIGYFMYKETPIKIYEAKVTKIVSQSVPGTITNITKNVIYVATQDFDIELIKLQLPSKKPMLVKDLLNGKNIFKD